MSSSSIFSRFRAQIFFHLFSPMSSLVKCYLFIYNFISCVGWIFVLSICLEEIASKGFWFAHSTLYPKVFNSLSFTQTLAVLECFHSKIGIVRSPFLSCFLQVLSRISIVWGILWPAESSRYQIGLTLAVTAWALTEIPRYLFYSLNQLTNSIPYPLTWLRYSTFMILYPVGICGELLCCWNAIPSLRENEFLSFRMPNRLNFGFDYVCKLYFDMIIIYPFASYFMYSHMLKQRRKVLDEKKEKFT